ncbi:hypothetical protein FRUB_05266 [Fimbriiglobus ruber]|uniref:Uncharacterized protein n=1 Tax=Fimbriiglobus ruber TaxID=1908690 RepID=A0A225DVX1_9BACT|nr:hypothetical protein FRUB_05266 [Fimbriiglobus ruber]
MIRSRLNETWDDAPKSVRYRAFYCVGMSSEREKVAKDKFHNRTLLTSQQYFGVILG